MPPGLFSSKSSQNSLQRFIIAQNSHAAFSNALREIQNGQKTGHWIWYVFPQLQGLGTSSTSKTYAIADLEEACAYLQNDQLFKNYFMVTTEVEKQLKTIPLDQLMNGTTDAKKLISSLTLFQLAAQQLAMENHANQDQYIELSQKCQNILDKVDICLATLDKIKEFNKSSVDVVNHEITEFKPINLSPIVASTSLQTAMKLKINKEDAIKKLDLYIADRKQEWSFHYNFLGLVAAIYFIHDALWGTDYFNSKSRDTKISAATKMKAVLEESSSDIKFTSAEQKALREGRLGDFDLEETDFIKPPLY